MESELVDTSLMQRSDAGAQPENFLPTDPWLRDVELDAQWRRDWMVRFKSEEPPCESTVDELIGHGLHALAQIEANVAATTAMKRTSTCDMARTWYNHENHRLYGNAQAVAWGVSPLEVVAWLMHADSRYLTSKTDENDVFFHAVGEPGVRHRVVHLESKAGLRNRSFLNALVCKQLSDEPPTFAWATGPIAHYEGVRDNVGVVRAEAFRFLRLTAVNDHVTRMEYLCWIDLKGHIPKFVIDALVIPKLMHIPISVQLYFFQIHVPTAPEAGTLIGHMLMDAVEARPHSEREAAIASFVSKMAVLRALRDLQFPHICAMLNAVICPTWRDHRPGSASNSPARAPVDSASNSPARAPVGSASNSPARALVGSGTSSPGLTPDRRFVVPSVRRSEPSHEVTAAAASTEASAAASMGHSANDISNRAQSASESASPAFAVSDSASTVSGLSPDGGSLVVSAWQSESPHTVMASIEATKDACVGGSVAGLANTTPNRNPTKKLSKGKSFSTSFLRSHKEFGLGAAHLTQQAAASLGAGISLIRMEHTVPDRAVDEVFLKPNMRQLEREVAWFRPMMHCIIKRKMADSLVSTTRLLLSSLLSMFALASAVASTVVFFLSGQTRTAFTLLGTILLCYALQVGLVSIRSMHCGWRAVMKEVGIVLSGFKPVIDLRRILSGYEVDGAPFSTTMERTMITAVETIAKSIPASIIATLALAVGRWQLIPFISILISWMTSAYRTMNMCCNMDTDCDNRRNVRRFYGYLPHPGPRRSAAKLVLLIASLAQIISKALSVTFLFLMGAFWLIGFMFIDVGLHLLYKLMCAPAHHCRSPGARSPKYASKCLVERVPVHVRAVDAISFAGSQTTASSSASSTGSCQSLWLTSRVRMSANASPCYCPLLPAVCISSMVHLVCVVAWARIRLVLVILAHARFICGFATCCMASRTGHVQG